jgi:excisionase family DNA binding protein
MTNKFPPTPPVIMTEAEIMEAEEQSLELEGEFLDGQKQPKQRTRTVEPRMLRTKEAAEYLGISEWKLRQMVVDGEIEVIKQKYFLFSIDDLNAWINKNREGRKL